MIEKYDDTLKKNIAPQKKEKTKPGASNVYADTEGETVFEEPIVAWKTQIKFSEPIKTTNIIHTNDEPNLKVGFSGWDKTNEVKSNNITSANASSFGLNKLFEAKPLTVKSFVAGLSKEERTEDKSEIIEKEKEENYMKSIITTF